MVAFAHTAETFIKTSPRARGPDRSCTVRTSLRTNSARYANLGEASYVGRVRLVTCSNDPIGYDGSKWNLYRYVNSNPIKFGDPNGLNDPGFWDEYWYFLKPGNNAPVDPAWLNYGSETSFCVAAGAAAGAGVAVAGGVEVTIVSGGNVFKVICRKWKCGFRIDPAHHGKPWGHRHWWRW